MKLQLTVFLISLFIVAFGIGMLVDAITETPARQMPGGYTIHQSSNAGFGASLAVFGLGAGIGIPLMLKQRKST